MTPAEALIELWECHEQAEQSIAELEADIARLGSPKTYREAGPKGSVSLSSFSDRG